MKVCVHPWQCNNCCLIRTTTEAPTTTTTTTSKPTTTTTSTTTTSTGILFTIANVLVYFNIHLYKFVPWKLFKNHHFPFRSTSAWLINRWTCKVTVPSPTCLFEEWQLNNFEQLWTTLNTWLQVNMPEVLKRSNLFVYFNYKWTDY